MNVNKHAKCVSKLLNNGYSKTTHSSQPPASDASPSFRQLNDAPIMSRFEKLKARTSNFRRYRFGNVARIHADPNNLTPRKRNSPSRRFNKLRIQRIRRSANFPIRVVTRSNYTIHSTTGGMSPFGLVAKMLTKQVLAFKNKTEMTPLVLNLL